jgi:hypothetical protein
VANYALKIADLNCVADLDGRSKSKIRPETKLLTTLCSPKPMPTLKAPARRLTLEKSTPSTPSAGTNPRARIM